MLPSELTNTIEQFIVHVHRNEAHFTYIYVFEADNIYKNPPPNIISPIWLFLLRSVAPPMTLLTAGALTDPQLSATASNACTTDARLGGVGRVPPQILATPVSEYYQRNSSDEDNTNARSNPQTSRTCEKHEIACNKRYVTYS